VAWIRRTFDRCLAVDGIGDVPIDYLFFAAHEMFSLMKIYALISKHQAFAEEREWRIIYMPDRDYNGLLKDRFSYIVGRRGIEPKLKFKIEPLAIEPKQDWTFEGIVDQIILGPSLSSVLASNAIKRMLDINHRSSFKEKLWLSNIPLRPD
jgi:hypothetical protein